MNLVRLAVIALLLTTVAIARTAYSEGYGLICPLFVVYEADNGYVTYCNAYHTSCNDIPTGILYTFDDEPTPCDCPDSSGCYDAPSGFGMNDAIRPIVSKVAIDGRPAGLAPQAKIAKSFPAYFMVNEEPVYTMLFELVFIDDVHLDRTCSMILGVEMKSPITGTKGLTEIKDWQATDLPFVFKANLAGRSIYLVRALGVTGKDVKAPTPADSQASKASRVSVFAKPN